MSVLMPHDELCGHNYETETHCKYSMVIWPCYANTIVTNEHAGYNEHIPGTYMQASAPNYLQYKTEKQDKIYTKKE